VKRRLFTIITALSLLSWVMIGALWLRSLTVRDAILWQPSQATATYLETSPGFFFYASGHIDPPATLPIGHRTDGGPFHFGDVKYYGVSLGLHTDVFYRDTGTSRFTYEMVRASFLWPMSIFGILPLCWMVGKFRRWARQQTDATYRCSVCGYDLRATPHRCPECGTYL